MKVRREDFDNAMTQLRAILTPGDTVYCVLRHVSRSGMSREISLYAMQDGEPRWLDGYARHVLGMRLGKRDGLVTQGCGMDMGFHLVYNLSRAIFGHSFPCTGEPDCPSNHHNNGDRDYTAGKPHSDGGYALRHRWM